MDGLMLLVAALAVLAAFGAIAVVFGVDSRDDFTGRIERRDP
jgi:hypothetical protein